MRNLALVGIITLAGCGDAASEALSFADVSALGEAFFADVNFSRARTQACATCHDPERAFTDGRPDPSTGLVSATSLGDDGFSLGARNAPSAAYASLAPAFAYGERRRFHKQRQHRVYAGALGGQFWDGRAATLEEQAGGPPLNPAEMNMPNKAAILERIREDARYVDAMASFFGEGVLDDGERAYAAFTQAIAAYERSETFAPFDSRYDRSLRGEVLLSSLELTGKALFFSQFTNCSICHQLRSQGDPAERLQEPFTGYEYHNLGIPANDALRAQTKGSQADPGLAVHGDKPAEEQGQFKVPTLRNVAVTGPYMHNGVFRNLRTVIAFYDHHNNPARATNPETGQAWREPETPGTVARTLLEVGDPLRDTQIDALVCFLRALTDRRYEPLLEGGELDCSR